MKDGDGTCDAGVPDLRESPEHIVVLGDRKVVLVSMHLVKCFFGDHLELTGCATGVHDVVIEPMVNVHHAEEKSVGERFKLGKYPQVRGEADELLVGGEKSKRPSH